MATSILGRSLPAVSSICRYTVTRIVTQRAYSEQRQVKKPAPPKVSVPKNDITIKPHDSSQSHFWRTILSDNDEPVEYYQPGKERPRKYPRLWIRDACTCDKCVDPSSGQKRFATTDIPDSLPIENISPVEDGSLQITWKDDFLTGDKHVSIYPATLWPDQRPERPEKKSWDRQTLTSINPRCSYEGFMAGEDEYRAAVKTLAAYGILFLSKAPIAETTVEDVAARLGAVEETFYGRTWDVRSKPNAENVAYTNAYLGLHQDLLYMHTIPRLQLLHCLENTCAGGESIFADGQIIARTIKARYPEEFKLLRRSSIDYHYNKNGHSFASSRKIISSKDEVRWAPPFQRPAQYRKMPGHWVGAARIMKGMLDDESRVYEYKMEPGDMVIFDNHRVLHGRRQFDTSSGARWLKGTYVDHLSYSNLLNHLASLGAFRPSASDADPNTASPEAS
ncbi:Clavaminate synthase-like protein [Poronia punctata]|nr:Clavaminate synthase-like protein [Poronia punctata]